MPYQLTGLLVSNEAVKGNTGLPWPLTVDLGEVTQSLWVSNALSKVEIMPVYSSQGCCED